MSVGKIYELRLMIEFSGTNRTYCYVRYCTENDAKEAVRRLHNYRIRSDYPLAVTISVDNRSPVLKICFGPPTAESKNLKTHVNFGVGDLFFRSPALWSSQNVFGPPTAGRVVVDSKDREQEAGGKACAQLRPHRS